MSFDTQETIQRPVDAVKNYYGVPDDYSVVDKDGGLVCKTPNMSFEITEEIERCINRLPELEALNRIYEEGLDNAQKCMRAGKRLSAKNFIDKALAKGKELKEKE